MRVVILADFAVPNGGAPKVALQSARALAEAGLGVAYVHAIGDRGDALLDHPRIERIGLAGVDVWDLPTLKGLADGLWNGAAAKRLASVLAAMPAGETVVHLHQWTRGFSPSIFPVLARCRHPFAVTLHDYFLACPNGLYYRFEQDRPCDLRPMSLGCLTARCDPKSTLVKAVRTMRAGLTNHALRQASFDVIHVSDRGQETIAPFLPAGVRRHRVDNPVEIARQPPAKIRADAPVAYIGRLTHEKGADLVAAAAKEAGVPALFIGEGPLEASIRQINPDAELLGWRSAGEVAALLQGGIQAVAAPSRWYETGPLTVYEALASGVPPVVSSRAGASEKVAHGETGFVVEPEVAALAAAFRDVARPGVAERLGETAHRRYWTAPPTPAAHASRLIEVYRAMLAREPSRLAPTA
jgi:glycosyltransferase involved in cell wall biosynthesis